MYSIVKAQDKHYMICRGHRIWFGYSAAVLGIEANYILLMVLSYPLNMRTKCSIVSAAVKYFTGEEVSGHQNSVLYSTLCVVVAQ